MVSYENIRDSDRNAPHRKINMCVNIREERQGRSPRTRTSVLGRGLLPCAKLMGGEDITEDKKKQGNTVSKLALALSVIRLLLELLR